MMETCGVGDCEPGWGATGPAGRHLEKGEGARSCCLGLELGGEDEEGGLAAGFGWLTG